MWRLKLWLLHLNKNQLDHELLATKAYLEASTDLGKYETSTLAALHAELNLAICGDDVIKKRNGEIGTSKDCCVTCVVGVSALRQQGYVYTIKQTQAKPYMSRLSGVPQIDREIMKSVGQDFQEWLRRLDRHPASDVSDDEEDLQTMSSEEIARLHEIVETFDIEN